MVRTERIPIHERAEAAIIARMRYQTTACGQMPAIAFSTCRECLRRFLRTTKLSPCREPGVAGSERREAMMRIVLWNCAMRLRGEKLRALESLHPDIAVVSACESPQKLWGKQPLLAPIPMEWIGDNENKGLAVLAFNGYRLKRHPDYDPSLHWMLPAEIKGPVEFRLLAVWAMQQKRPQSKGDESSVQLPVRYYHPFLKDRPAIVAGSFAGTECATHARTIAGLERLGMASAYHVGRGELHGKESLATWYGPNRKADQPQRHVDYCFLPLDWCSGLSEVEVGSVNAWVGKGLSDHVPLIVDVDVQARRSPKASHRRASPNERICRIATGWRKDKRQKRNRYALTEEGMVLCNSRDKEAAHRAEMEGTATDDHAAVTCRKCLSLLHERGKVEREG